MKDKTIRIEIYIGPDSFVNLKQYVAVLTVIACYVNGGEYEWNQDKGWLERTTSKKLAQRVTHFKRKYYSGQWHT